ncbi:MAG TPA: hypothetical protein VKO84_07190 [Gaiellaceae bacterium]|nr:hypothetical protein [Gaiellaceae bacterium]
MELENLSADVLANWDMVLEEPKSAPSMDESEAAVIARKAAGGAAVLEARYAYCRVSGRHPNIEQDCWAFSLDPTGRRSTIGRFEATCSLVLVDPISGSILLDRIGRPSTDPSVVKRDPPPDSA